MNKKAVIVKENGVSRLMRGVITAVTISLGMTACFAYAIIKGIVPETAAAYTVMATVLVSSFVSACVTAGGNDIWRMGAMLSGLVNVIVMLLINIAIFRDGFSGIGATVALVICGCGLAALRQRPKKRGGKRRKRR